jgi:general secretion pathway protein J
MMNSSSRGFTLFEILVAVSIFAIIGTMTMSSLIQVGRTGEQVSEAQRELSRIQFALGYLGKDVIQLVNRKIRDQFGDEQPQLKITENSLVFTRSGWGNLLGQPRSNLQRVEYRLDDDNLQRRYWPQLDQAYTEMTVEQNLLSNVEDFSIRLLTAGEETYDTWPVDVLTSEPLKPVAIELILNLKGFGEIRRIYELSDALL